MTIKPKKLPGTDLYEALTVWCYQFGYSAWAENATEFHKRLIEHVSGSNNANPEFLQAIIGGSIPKLIDSEMEPICSLIHRDIFIIEIANDGSRVNLQSFRSNVARPSTEFEMCIFKVKDRLEPF
jgi:hypothetical protein